MENIPTTAEIRSRKKICLHFIVLPPDVIESLFQLIYRVIIKKTEIFTIESQYPYRPTRSWPESSIKQLMLYFQTDRLMITQRFNCPDDPGRENWWIFHHCHLVISPAREK
jgi:hypothetical protein